MTIGVLITAGTSENQGREGKQVDKNGFLDKSAGLMWREVSMAMDNHPAGVQAEIIHVPQGCNVIVRCQFVYGKRNKFHVMFTAERGRK